MERIAIRRGEIWDVNLDPVVGREQGGRRPALILSSDLLHALPSRLAFAVPITSRDRGARWHVRIEPPAGGLTVPSFVLCEQMRAISTRRLVRRRGVVGDTTLVEVAAIVRLLLDFP